MCRSIKQLRRADSVPTQDEIHAAALQFVRKVSGYRKPSRANQEAFERAVAQIETATQLLLGSINQSIEQTDGRGIDDRGAGFVRDGLHE